MNLIANITIELGGLWGVLALAYTCFCFWMFCSCIYREEEAAERLSWAIFFIFLSWIIAPIYFWKRYRVLHAERKKAEAKAAQDLKELLSPCQKS